MKKEKGLERIDTYAPDAQRNVTVNFHPAGMTSECHTHDFYEINYVLGGELVNEISGRSVRMRAGDAVLLHPGVFHIPSAGEGATVLNILIRPHWLERALASVGDGPLFRFASTASGEDYMEYLLFFGASDAEDAARLLLAERGATAPHAALAAEGGLLLLLAALGRAWRVEEAEGRDAGFSRFAGILAYLYEHSATVTAATLAARFGYSSAHLSRLFRRYTGTTPAALLQRTRLDRAAALLLVRDATVTAVATEVGIPCLPYFHRIFRRTFAMTPEEYRRRGGCNFRADGV